MPLVVPGLSSTGGSDDKTSKWMNELVGKKIGEDSNETVCLAFPIPFPLASFCEEAGFLADQ